jgi:hypothetical protein
MERAWRCASRVLLVLGLFAAHEVLAAILLGDAQPEGWWPAARCALVIAALAGACLAVAASLALRPRAALALAAMTGPWAVVRGEWLERLPLSAAPPGWAGYVVVGAVWIAVLGAGAAWLRVRPDGGRLLQGIGRATRLLVPLAWAYVVSILPLVPLGMEIVGPHLSLPIVAGFLGGGVLQLALMAACVGVGASFRLGDGALALAIPPMLVLALWLLIGLAFAFGDGSRIFPPTPGSAPALVFAEALLLAAWWFTVKRGVAFVRAAAQPS